MLKNARGILANVLWASKSYRHAGWDQRGLKFDTTDLTKEIYMRIYTDNQSICQIQFLSSAVGTMTQWFITTDSKLFKSFTCKNCNFCFFEGSKIISYTSSFFCLDFNLQRSWTGHLCAINKNATTQEPLQHFINSWNDHYNFIVIWR